MSGFALFAFLFSAIFAAVNAALYAADGNPFSLGAAILCGSCAVANLAIGLRS